MKPVRTSKSYLKSTSCFGISALSVLWLLVLAGSTFGEIIPASRRIEWVPEVTVGVQTLIPPRSRLLDVTKPPYNADKTGATSASAAIQSAINAAQNNDVIYLPAGRYRINPGISIDKSFVTLRGEGTNSILLGLTASSFVLKVGHDAMSADVNRTYIVTSGATKGSTTLMLQSVQNAYGDTLKPGDMLLLSHSTRNTGSDGMPIISVANYDGIIKQTVVVSSRNGNTLSLTSPLVWDFTNSPVLGEISTISAPRSNVSIENLSITLTNNGEHGSSIFIINSGCLRDCRFSNLDLGYANNYQLYLTYAANCEVRDSTIHDALSIGTSHSGLILANDSGCLIQNNIFANGLFPAIEVNDGVMGCAFFANHFSANSTDVDVHNTHPMMNLFEANIFTSFFELDGYFGSASHFTLFRNRIQNTLPLKRWTSNIQIVGNVMVSTNASYTYSTEQPGYGAPWPVFELGYPNIGNSGYAGSSPPVAWNFPGRSLTGFFQEKLTNGIFTFSSNQGPTNVLWGNFTNVPAPVGAGYALIFQDGVNTNKYYGAPGSGVLLSVAAGTSSNLVLNSVVTVSNGWTLYIAGQNAYQQLQSSNKFTHILHGNLVYTNAAGAVVWDPTIADHTIPVSLLYTNGAPSWWGTNRWPAFGPDVNPATSLIAAQERFLGIPVGIPPKPPAPTISRTGP